MLILVAACVLAAGAWVYLLAGHGGFWRTDVRLPGRAGAPDPGRWPRVAAVVPARGAAAGQECDYLLFTDADIAFDPGTVTSLVRAAVADDRALVSQMAVLRAETGWERWIVPAFVYFFAQLYPFRRVGRTRARTAAA